jgi:outer membrane protein OmpA-like peptidoglycan-associated protein
MIKNLLSVTAIVLLGITQYAVAYDEDYPMFSAYPGADRDYAKMTDYEKIALPLSKVDNKNPVAFTPLILVGDVYKHTYAIENVSSLKVFENYRAAANQANFKLLYSCALDACGTEEQAQDLGAIISISNNVYNSYHNPYYLIGEKTTTKGKLIAAWFIGAYDTKVTVQQVIVETEPLELNLIQVNPAYADPAGGITKTEALSDEEKAKDHPMLTRYPRADLQNVRKTDTETVEIPFAKNAASQTPLKLTGDLYRHLYEIQNTSTLKVYENYKTALTKGGFSFLSQCELTQCGDDQESQNLGGKISINKNVYNNYRNPYYLLAKKTISDRNVYIALFIGAYDTEVAVQQVILEEKSVQTGLVTVNADELKQQIETDGKALIYGIYFDTSKASIKPESKPTLDAIAELLKKNPSLLLYVVGHTDDTGSVAANLELSKQRAKSVVDALTSGYQIAANRLQAEGVGPYAPASNNTTDAGKQKNRRVELVKRLQ